MQTDFDGRAGYGRELDEVGAQDFGLTLQRLVRTRANRGDKRLTSLDGQKGWTERTEIMPHEPSS
eukprot:2154140-Pyramimonas_sp.AAC.1